MPSTAPSRIPYSPDEEAALTRARVFPVCGFTPISVLPEIRYSRPATASTVSGSALG